MNHNADKNYWLLVLVIILVTVGMYYFIHQLQSNTTPTATQDAQCESLGSKYYTQQKGDVEAGNTPNNITVVSQPYYSFSNKLDACIYITDFNYLDGGPNNMGQYQLVDLSHGNSMLATYFLPYESNVASIDQGFCKTFNELFGSEIERYKGVGLEEKGLGSGSPLVAVAGICDNTPAQ